MSDITLAESEQAAKIAALVEWHNNDHDGEPITVDDVGTCKHDDSLFTIEGEDYLVLDDEEADDRAEQQIMESVWAFRPGYLTNYMEIGTKGQKILERIQAEFSEDANELFVALIKSGRPDKFVRNAIDDDGRGHFLSGYDGEEHESGNYYIYKQG